MRHSWIAGVCIAAAGVVVLTSESATRAAGKDDAAAAAKKKPGQAGVFQLRTRQRKEPTPGCGHFDVIEEDEKWDAAKTAIIICDMWNEHWCKGATRRVGEMAPKMNAVVAAARKKGALIIHAPSSTMKFYADTPQRKRAQQAPKHEPPVPIIGWCHLDPKKEAALPIDDSDGGCDCQPKCKGGGPWTRQHAGLTIAPEDAISDNGQEVYNLLAARGVKNVVLMGVHTNMCVLGRPFGIRQLRNMGFHVALARDLTDTMYNSRMKPFVKHEKGTELVVEHIEKYWAVTIQSDDLLGKKKSK